MSMVPYRRNKTKPTAGGRLAEDLPWQNQGRLQQLYREHDLLLFPSLRDSRGMVVLEALSHGLPVMCLNLGGPGVAVDENCGRVIATSGCAEPEVVEAMARAMQELWRDSELLRRLSDGARRRVAAFSWSRKVRWVYPLAVAT